MPTAEQTEEPHTRIWRRTISPWLRHEPQRRPVPENGKASPVYHRPGTHPALSRSGTKVRHRRPTKKKPRPPDRLTTEPAAGPSPSEKRVASAAATGGSSTGKQREAPVHSLPRPKALDLEKQTLTYLTEAPGSAPPQRGRGRRDLFQNDDAAPASSPPPGHETLEKLGPKLPANGEPTVFPTSRSLDGHRRRRRPPAPPAETKETDLSFFSPLYTVAPKDQSLPLKHRSCCTYREMDEWKGR